MRKIVRIAKRNPANRDLAQLIVANVAPKDWYGEINACFRFVRDEIRYSLDTSEIEVLQSPQTTLKLGYGDCDDKCILLSTLLENLGHPCAFYAMGFDPYESYSHVIVIVIPAGDGEPIALDTTEAEPMGWIPEGITHAIWAEI